MNRVETFKDRLSALMKEKGETVTSLARATSISKSTISEWCSGRKPMLDDAIVRVARYLHVSLEQLITGIAVEEDLVADFLNQAENEFVTLHSGIYRLKVEKLTGRTGAKKRNGK